MVRVELTRVDFRYPVYEMRGRSLKLSLLRQVTGGQLGGDDHVEIRALNQVSLSLRPGDRLGLIGHNGSGKSTLLRVMAGLAYPQAGSVDVSGRVISLIEKGLGYNPELTGRANIELPLRLLGASDEDVRRAKSLIPEFTGLGAFIDMPVRTYSEGMKTRLAFAICTAVSGDILLLDEWLGAGDLDFQAQAEARLKQMMDSAKIMVLATHSLPLVREVCNKVAYLAKGRVIGIGAPDEMIELYHSAADRVHNGEPVLDTPVPHVVMGNAAY